MQNATLFYERLFFYDEVTSIQHMSLKKNEFVSASISTMLAAGSGERSCSTPQLVRCLDHLTPVLHLIREMRLDNIFWR